MQTVDQLREHFTIECELADRLRSASTEQERRRLYGEVYSERSQRIAHHPLVARAADCEAVMRAAAPQVRLLRRFLTPHSLFVEVGAGDGAVARAVAPLVRRSIALDVTDTLAMLDDPPVGYSFRLFDGFDLAIRGADVVYSNDVVEHLHRDDFGDHARGVLEALRSGGRYVCVTPNRLTGPHDVSRTFSDTPKGFHLCEYTATELTSALRAAGFRHVQVVLTMAGRRLTPVLPAGAVRPLEALVGTLPRGLRVPAGPLLASIKVLATK